MHAGCAAPLVEDIEDVRLAEVNLHRPPPRTRPVVALEVTIDPLERDLDRDAARRPGRHHLEGRSDDADQVPVVLPTEVGLDLAAVIRNLQSAIRNVYWFLSHTSRN